MSANFRNRVKCYISRNGGIVLIKISQMDQNVMFNFFCSLLWAKIFLYSHKLGLTFGPLNEMIPAPVSKSRNTPTLNETSGKNTFPHQANQRDSYIPSWSRETFSISFCSLNSFDFIEDVCRSLLIAFLGSSSFRKKEGSLTISVEKRKSCYS